ncbi:unnamed protein product, partial [Ectocarpus sp. 12 AP-2014]
GRSRKRPPSRAPEPWPRIARPPPFSSFRSLSPRLKQLLLLLLLVPAPPPPGRRARVSASSAFCPPTWRVSYPLGRSPGRSASWSLRFATEPSTHGRNTRRVPTTHTHRNGTEPSPRRLHHHGRRPHE